uniref:Uncharacterized protein n=1 Tax=Echeneis naucrates TaxID=173247 RepID=A0A665VH94_ECHNA
MHGQRQTLDRMSAPPKCCICLDEFTSPVSLPCGHSFCLFCIGEHWRIHPVCQCPLCKAIFPTRPQLRTDPATQTKDATSPIKAGEVPCDFCPARSRAVMSCLVCLASYCNAHLEPHYQSEELGRHLLINVVKNLEDSVCRLHGRQLDKFCRSDQTCICALCAQAEHRGHHIIPISKEASKKKNKLQQTIQERLSKLEKIKLSADSGGENSKEAWKPNKDLIKQLEEEISELQQKKAELEKLLQTEDNLHFLQVCITTHESLLHRCATPNTSQQPLIL